MSKKLLKVNDTHRMRVAGWGIVRLNLLESEAGFITKLQEMTLVGHMAYRANDGLARNVFVRIYADGKLHRELKLVMPANTNIALQQMVTTSGGSVLVNIFETTATAIRFNPALTAFFGATSVPDTEAQEVEQDPGEAASDVVIPLNLDELQTLSIELEMATRTSRSFNSHSKNDIVILDIQSTYKAIAESTPAA